MSRRRALILGPLSALFVLLTVAVPQSAQAYTQQSLVTVEQQATFCIKADAGIDHFTPGVFSGNNAWARVYAFAADCATVLPAMQVRVKLEVRKWNESSSAWVTCKTTDWAYGTTSRDQFGPVGPGVHTGYTPCGSGWHQTKAQAQSYRYVNSVGQFLWLGGILNSGYEWVN